MKVPIEVIVNRRPHRVEVDTQLAGNPQQIFLITSRGWTGPSGSPRAQASVKAWLDARTMQVLRWDE